MEAKKNAAYRLGVIILVVLAVLTGIEYFLALLDNATILLFIVALLKAVVIMEYFMHMSALWSEGGH